MSKNILGAIPDAFKVILGAGLWDAFKELAEKWIRTKLDPSRRQDFFKAYITNMIRGNLSSLYDEACENKLELADGTVILEDAFVDLFSEFSAEDLMLASITMDMMEYKDAKKSLGVMYNNPLQQRVKYIRGLAKKHLKKPQKAVAKASIKAWLKVITLADDRKKIADDWNTKLMNSAKKEKTQLAKTDDDDKKIAALKKQLNRERKRRW